MMGNINDYGLLQMKRIMLVEGNSQDGTFLECLRQAVDEINPKVGGGLSVTVTGSSYVLSPDPGATSLVWNAIAWAAVVLYRTDELRQFLDQMEGLSTLRDDVLAMGRSATIKAKQDLLKQDIKNSHRALYDYRRDTSTGVVSMEEIGLREDDTEEEDDE